MNNTDLNPIEDTTAEAKRANMLKKRFKECPYCSKPISKNASVCRHCRRTLEVSPPPKDADPEMQEFLASALADIDNAEPKLPSIDEVIDQFPTEEPDLQPIPEAELAEQDEEENEGEDLEVIEEGEPEPEEDVEEDEVQDIIEEEDVDEAEESESEDDAKAEEETEDEAETTEAPLQAIDPSTPPDESDETIETDEDAPKPESTGFFDNTRNLIIIGAIAIFMVLITIVNIFIFTTILGGG